MAAAARVTAGREATAEGEAGLGLGTSLSEAWGQAGAR